MSQDSHNTFSLEKAKLLDRDYIAIGRLIKAAGGKMYTKKDISY